MASPLIPQDPAERAAELARVRQRIVDLTSLKSYLQARGAEEALIQDLDRALQESLVRERALMA